MKLVSLCCSGESLEKAVALFYTSYKDNKNFYDYFEEIVLFYSENLPKKNRNMNAMSGTVSSLCEIHTSNFSIPQGTYEKRKLINLLVQKEIITDRVGWKLEHDDERFDKILKNLPIEYLYGYYYQNVIDKFSNMFPNVKLVKLSIRDGLEEFISNNYGYDGHSKVYGLQPDGYIGIYNLGNWGKIKQFNMMERIKRSICLSPNIYVYILMIDLWVSSKKDIVIGYRPMKRFKRQAYDLSIKRLKSSTYIEPPNIEFGKVLDNISYKLSVEERSNIGILKCFENFLNS